jgi:hypothetical protein
MLLIYVVHSDVDFRKSGLEHSASVKKDLEWFGEQRVEYLYININYLLFLFQSCNILEACALYE